MSHSQLTEALVTCQSQRAQEIVKSMMDSGVSAERIITECNLGMTELGERFARGDCFVPELMIGGRIMKQIATMLGPQLEKAAASLPTIGKAVMGSVRGDLHNIGKDIVAMMLHGSGFQVIDLGVNVPQEKFVQAIKEHQPCVVGLSVLLTTCWGAVVQTVAAIREAGLRQGTAIMVGGAAASERLCAEAGCDFYGKTAVDGMSFARGRAKVA